VIALGSDVYAPTSRYPPCRTTSRRGHAALLSTDRQMSPHVDGVDQSRVVTHAGPGGPRNRSSLAFFLLVFALSIPFWLIGAVTDRELMPGLSVSALMAFCPMVAALILVHRENRAAGVIEMLSRSVDFRRISAMRWLVPVLLLMPGVNVVVYSLMRWMDMSLPAVQFSAAAALLMGLAFFVGALGEELGWSGYVIDPLQDRWNALTASLVLGVVGVLWHLVPFLLLQRPSTWIAWWCLYALAARVLTVWLYNNTGRSVFAASLFHATLNLTYMLFPVYGSHFDMRLGGLIMASVAVVVTVIWGPKTLRFSATDGSTLFDGRQGAPAPPPLGRLAVTAIALEILLGVGAVGGGIALMAGPNGEILPLPVSALAGSPFANYFVPGAILFAILGIGPLGAAVLARRRHPVAPVLAFAVGIALLIWLIVEIAIVGYADDPPLQALYLGLGVAITAVGVGWIRENAP
jgi:uncharacterized protein